MSRTFAIALGAALAATLGLIAHTEAYTYNGSKWSRGQMPVPYTVSNELSGDVRDAEALEAIQLGHTAWDVLACSYMLWSYAGRTENTSWGAQDGENVNTWREAMWNDSATALGIATFVNDFSGNLTDCDIKFNGENHAWAHFDASGAGGFDNRTDIASVSAHETGHCIGLGHTDVAGSTMWPSTGPGDVSGRSLGADDIQGACEIYPSGGEVPPPDIDPMPTPGVIPFGDDCSEARCLEDLFCVSDGRESYCTRPCRPASSDCPAEFYCAQLAGGENDGACAKGNNPGNLAGFGEACGPGQVCQSGFTCVNDGDDLYCTGPCLGGSCPEGYFCAELQGGADACARGDSPMGGMLPGQGASCADRGLCREGLFCLNDTLNTDSDGNVVPYCTGPCPSGACDQDYRCVPVDPDGTACQLIPSPGRRELGQACWVNPEAPWDMPTCGSGLVCVGADIDQLTLQIRDPGTCTKNCTPSSCCPEGWGCLELTPAFAQCQRGRSDDEGWSCDPSAGAGGDGGAGGLIDGGLPGTEEDPGADGGGGGCQIAPLPPAASLLALVLLLGLRRRRDR